MVYGIDSLIHLLSPYVHKNRTTTAADQSSSSSSNIGSSGNNKKSPMDVDEFRRVGKQMVDYIADYMENIAKRRVVPNIEPGYLRRCLPKEAPNKPETFEHVLRDVESYIMPGVTHWQHPRFHAYFPAGNSFPSILADMLSDAIGCVGFSWAASPACTELEMIMLDWYGQMIGLPKEFLPFTEHGRGGGVIQGSASECILVSLLAARFEIIKGLKAKYPFVEEGILLSKLMAYCSKEAHSSVEKACMIGLVKLRILETDKKFRLRGETLKAAIAEDRNIGLIPFFVSSTLGTTSCCSFDILSEIGPVCKEESIWLHVDAAYAGSSFMCPEFKYLMNGIEYAMSVNTNPNKWLLVNFDCSTMWVKDRFRLTQALVVDPLYLQHGWMDKAIDYRHWGIPLSRRFRSLKLWFVIRMYGIEGLQRYIREHVRLAKKFEQLLRSDNRFEIMNDVILALVCFRLRTSNEVNQKLLTKINASGRLHMVPASLNDKFVIRFCVCAERASDRDIVIAFEIIRQIATSVLAEPSAEPVLLEEDEENANEKEKRAADEQNEQQQNEIENAADYANDSNSSTRKSHTLSEKRSFFVRMVSDPKCYNPKIVRTLNTRQRKLSDDVKRDLAIKMDIACSTDSSDNEQATPTTTTSTQRRLSVSSDKKSIKEEEGTLENDAAGNLPTTNEDVFIPVGETGIITPM